MGGQTQTGSRSILLNGQPKEVVAKTLEQLLDEVGHDPAGKGIAVALNGEVVPRGRWHYTSLSNGDAVEIVGAVQGG